MKCYFSCWFKDICVRSKTNCNSSSGKNRNNNQFSVAGYDKEEKWAKVKVSLDSNMITLSSSVVKLEMPDQSAQPMSNCSPRWMFNPTALYNSWQTCGTVTNATCIESGWANFCAQQLNFKTQNLYKHGCPSHDSHLLRLEYNPVN